MWIVLPWAGDPPRVCSLRRKALCSPVRCSLLGPKLIEMNPGGFPITMFPDQEPCVRGPPSKNLVHILRGGSSYTRFLTREHSNRKPPVGGFLSIKVVNRVFTICLAQWLGWVFETKERKKESTAQISFYSLVPYPLRTRAFHQLDFVIINGYLPPKKERKKRELQSLVMRDSILGTFCPDDTCQPTGIRHPRKKARYTQKGISLKRRPSPRANFCAPNPFFEVSAHVSTIQHHRLPGMFAKWVRKRFQV